MESDEDEVVFLGESRTAAAASPPAQRERVKRATAPRERGGNVFVDLTGDSDEEPPAQRRRRAAPSGGGVRGSDGARGGRAGAASWREVIDLTEDTEIFARAWADSDCVIVGEKAPPERPPKVLDLSGLDVLSEHRKGVQAFLSAKASSLKILARQLCRSDFLPALTACAPQELQENKHSLPGTPLFTRFVQAWANSDTKVDMVFHGTPEANVEAICREGLDPKRRAGQAMGPGEYFGEDASTSVGYCRGGKKMLIFAVLTDRSGVTARGGGVTVIHRVEHQLPIFVVTFDSVGVGAGPQAMMPPWMMPASIARTLATVPPSAMAAFLRQLISGFPGVAAMLPGLAASNLTVAALLPTLGLPMQPPPPPPRAQPLPVFAANPSAFYVGGGIGRQARRR